MADTKKPAKKSRKPKGYVGFKALEKKLSKQPGVTNPGALAAYIGRKKYGAKRFNKAAAAGKPVYKVKK